MMIYLAGPITGCNFSECLSWRGKFKAMIPKSIQCLSPMRGETVETIKRPADGCFDNNGPLATQKGIMTRDFFDCTRADLLVAYFLDTRIVSIGTCMEIAWAFMNKTPVISIIEEGNLHDHPMIREATGFRVSDLQEAASVCKVVLCPREI